MRFVTKDKREYNFEYSMKQMDAYETRTGNSFLWFVSESIFDSHKFPMMTKVDELLVELVGKNRVQLGEMGISMSEALENIVPELVNEASEGFMDSSTTVKQNSSEDSSEPEAEEYPLN